MHAHASVCTSACIAGQLDDLAGVAVVLDGGLGDPAVVAVLHQLWGSHKAGVAEAISTLHTT